ncbi:glycosyl hydrolase [Paenibacillus donghaensis]|uniref:Glycosyl hydrolase n=1 Tax=Paenibacillus donghaensis TaxID=414771 RepID=A0A2Z2KQE2_9BACL|nr:glycosyl hydrolase [Paenibacillus donghaensis]ASA26033.1 glycosyl hydrolase [Paenibacillus donghaensis]
MKNYRKYMLLTTLLPVILMVTLLHWTEARNLTESGDITLTEVKVPASAPIAPVNPEASDEASELLRDLVNLSGKGILSGQHDYLESPDEFNSKLKSATGKQAVLHGYELGALNNQSPATIAAQRQAVVASAIKWHKDGGIVAMTFHQSLPGTSPEWSRVQMNLSQAKFNAYVTPGTKEYQSLVAELDDIAEYLGELRDAGVPVMWRPYHEMNGGWFWWGKKNNFEVLWNIMYERFTDVHKLDNLLWVWNPNAPTKEADPYAPYYPGTDKVDVLAADIYNNDFRQSYYDNLLKLADGKPIGIGESGELPDPAMLAKKQSQWVYMMTWGKMLTENNNMQQIKSFMGSNYTVSREDFVRTEQAAIAPVSRNGLTGEYFNNAELSGTAAVIRKDSNIDFNWHGEGPAEGIGKDSFSIRWIGKVKPVYSEKYTFSASSDDGVRVWIDGKLVIDSWQNQSGVGREGSITLTAGTLYDIKVEYYENRGDASIRLQWKSARQKQSIIPQKALFLK